MNTYQLGDEKVDSIETKCLVVSRGLKVGRRAYKRFSNTYRLDINPLTCNCIIPTASIWIPIGKTVWAA